MELRLETNITEEQPWNKIYSYNINKRGELEYTTEKHRVVAGLDVPPKVSSLGIVLGHLQTEADPATQFHHLRLCTKARLVAVLRSHHFEGLSDVARALDDNQEFLKNIGRPLNVQIHSESAASLLSYNDDKVQFRGLVNLLILLLVTYAVRQIMSSLE